MTRFLQSLALITILVVPCAQSHAAVDYTRICSLYGASFFYIPQTDICVKVDTGETRQQTTEGTFSSSAPNTPGSWVPNPRAGCKGGRLVKLGTFTSADFSLNVYTKYVTPLVPLTLRPKEYIANVMMNGGFNVTDRSNLCISFYDVDLQYYSSLGCQNTGPMRDQQATWSFTPRIPLPPAIFGTTLNLLAGNADEQWPSPPLSFDGSVSCWVCLQRLTD